MLIESTLLLVGALGAGHGHLDSRNLIPAFARRYRIGCSHCHVAAPKLNSVGEAFRLNGYRFPEGQPELRGEPTIPLGEEPWKDLWPKAVWPGELPASVPLALRIQSDVEITRDATGRTGVNFRFPNEVYLLAGGGLGEHIGAFLEAGWDREDGPRLIQAKVKLQRLLPWRGGRLLNLWIGLQNLYLFTFADRQIDRAARQGFLWQRFRPSEVPLPGGLPEARPASAFRLGLTEPAIELNGLLGPRLYYGVGVGQGAGSATTDNNRRKDLYFKLRYKAGGLGLDGSSPSARPVSGANGQLREQGVVVEGFGYFGSEPTASGSESRHRSIGLNARLIRGPLDFGLGYVWGRDDDPWGTGAGALDHAILFAKGEYALFPWLLASVKGERFSIRTPRASRNSGRMSYEQHHVAPGVVVLIRQNLRAVGEADLFSTYESPSSARAPSGLWFRLDLAF